MLEFVEAVPTPPEDAAATSAAICLTPLGADAPRRPWHRFPKDWEFSS
jgi:hypothetical protein